MIFFHPSYLYASPISLFNIMTTSFNKCLMLENISLEYYLTAYIYYMLPFWKMKRIYQIFAPLYDILMLGLLYSNEDCHASNSLHSRHWKRYFYACGIIIHLLFIHTYIHYYAKLLVTLNWMQKLLWFIATNEHSYFKIRISTRIFEFYKCSLSSFTEICL